jgi:hypothetical protein
VENWSDLWRPSPDWDINTLGSCAPIAALYNTFKLHVRVIEGAAVALLPEVPADQ